MEFAAKRRKVILIKLLLGRNSKRQHNRNPLQLQLMNIQSIWNNVHHDDNGIEKIFRLLLSISQLLFPGIYLKYITFKKGIEYQDLVSEIYILLKVIFPIVMLYYDWVDVDFLIVLMKYFLLETALYIPTLIFASDLVPQPRSYRRSMILLFLNYMEIIFAYAVFYASGNYLNKPLTDWYDPIYFSITISSTIGFGEFYPVTKMGKFLVSSQALLLPFYVVLFLNFFSSKLTSKGYFKSDI